MSVQIDFRHAISAGQQLALMPVSRLVLNTECRIGDAVLYPAHSFDLADLRPVPNRDPGCLFGGGASFFDGQALREVLTSATGFNVEVLSASPLIAFPFPIIWEDFLAANHNDDIALLRRMNQAAENFIDVIRFEYCNFGLPDTLLGRAGSWNGSGPNWGALIYNPVDHESYLIAGSAAVASIVQGLGLEVDWPPTIKPPGGGEVGNFAKHALGLFRNVLECATESSKFTSAMALLEFLAFPDSNKCMGMGNVGKEIAAHFARDSRAYSEILGRFRALSGNWINGAEHGYRTLIVHQGRYLEELLPNEQDRRALFWELQQYASSVILDMIQRQAGDWHTVKEYRKERRRRIGVSKDK